MDNNKLGETSKTKNTDICDNERPLKKARYLWQVKGKYHLKDNNSKTLNTDKENDSSSSSANSSSENNVHEVLNLNNNIAQARNKNLYGDRSCIEALIASSDKIMDFPEPESPPKNIDKSISDEIPITLVKPNPKNEDYYLRKWQARQIAKGFVDNTINRVLESWMMAPFDASDFVENCDNGGQAEDEGILMAIQSHGLQSSADGSLNLKPAKSTYSTSKTSCTCSRTRSTTESGNLKSLTPFHRRSDNSDLTLEYYENLCVLKDTEPVQNNFFVNSYVSKPSSSSYNSDDSAENESSAISSEIDDTLKMNDTDFLDAAVAVAIQKKGLTSCSYVDCG